MHRVGLNGGLGDGEGGSGVGDGGGGEAGGGILQQASLHFAESDFRLFAGYTHILVHFVGVSPLHALPTLFRSFFLHVLLSLSAAQSSGDGAVVRALPLFIHGAGSIFTGVADGAAAPTQLSTLRAASRHVRYGILIICACHVGSSDNGFG